MIYVLIMSGVAAVIHFSMALIALAFARAPGWQSYRVFALIAFLLGIYALNDTFVLHQEKITSVTTACATANVAISTIVAALWLVFSRLREGHRLTHIDRILLTFLLPAFILTFIPGLVVDGTYATDIDSLGLHYRTPATTLFGDVVLVTNMATMILVASRYLRHAWGRSLGAKVSAFGFSVFVFLACEEVLVAYEVLRWPYLADLGFAGITLSFAVEMSARVSEDSHSLSDLNRSLEERVHARSEELAETREALLLAERHAAIGQIASGVGHEINNPLAYVNANLSFLREGPGTLPWGEDELEAIDEALDGVERIGRIVGDLTLFSGSREVTPEIASVKRAIERAIRIARPKNDSKLRFRSNGTDCKNVAIDESKLTQVLVNLLVNAAQASTPSGVVTTRCRLRGEQQLIEIIDSGCGVDEKDLERIFDPLYTTKDVGKGTGLGLFVCRAIIDSAGGSIVASRNPGGGMTVSVHLLTTTLRTTTVDRPRTAEATSAETLTSGLRIYVVDDETMVTRALQRMLRNANVVVQNDSQKALRHLLEDPTYDAIICDLMMPNFTGMELFEDLRATDSSLCDRFLFVTGGAVSRKSEEFLSRDDIRFLLKPLQPTELRSALNEIAGK